MPAEPFVCTSLEHLANEMNLSSQMVKTYIAKGMPGERGSYILRDCWKWYCENVRPRRNELNKSKPIEDEETKDLKRALDKQKLRDGELKFAEKVRELMPREHVREVFVRTSELYRTAGELLRKHHGDEAQAILLDAIEGALTELDNMFRSEDEV
jgi:hypothetical protein